MNPSPNIEFANVKCGELFGFDAAALDAQVQLKKCQFVPLNKLSLNELYESESAEE